jgi:hypothetical protein
MVLRSTGQWAVKITRPLSPSIPGAAVRISMVILPDPNVGVNGQPIVDPVGVM